MYANRFTVNPEIFIIAVGGWQQSKQKDNRSINNAVLSSPKKEKVFFLL
jgi:hypothetical protein